MAWADASGGRASCASEAPRCFRFLDGHRLSRATLRERDESDRRPAQPFADRLYENPVLRISGNFRKPYAAHPSSALPDARQSSLVKGLI